MSNCQLYGSLPSSISTLINLLELMMDSNYLISMPYNLSQLLHLQSLILSYNLIISPLPILHINNHLNALQINNNQFYGEIPISYNNFTEIGIIDLSVNKLSGIIDSKLFQIPSLLWIRLSHNLFQGINLNSLALLSHTTLINSIDVR